MLSVTKIRYLVPVISCLLVLLLNPMLKSEPMVENGVLDLREWDFNKSGTVSLKGDWEVYWERFIDPDEIDSYIADRSFFDVPGSWYDFFQFTSNTSGPRFATFRLKVLLSSSDDLMALNIKHIFSDFKVFVNGKLVSDFGDIHNNTDKSKNFRHPIIISDTFRGKQLEIVTQVSNYWFAIGGIFRPILLGPYQMVKQVHMKRLALELFLVGSLLIIGLYHFSAYYFRRRDIASLFFGVLCLLIVVRILFMGTRFILLFFPEITIDFSEVIEFSAIYLALAVFAIFIHRLYPEEVSKFVLNPVVFISVGLAVLAVVAGFNFPLYLVSVIIFDILAIIFLVYTCYALVKAFKHKREGAGILLVGFLFLMASGINDALFVLELAGTAVYLPYGVFVYIVFQAFNLSKRSAVNLSEKEALSVNLAEMNINLENSVKKRTKELHEKNDRLREEILEHRITAEKLVESRQNAVKANESKSEFLANVSHELRTPMHAILGFTKLGLARLEEIDKSKLAEYLKEVHKSASRLLYLLNDLLDLSKLESGKMDFKFGSVSLYKLINIVKDEFSVVAAERGVDLIAEKPGFVDEVSIDSEKVTQVLRNLVSNAIRFSPDGSVVNLTLSQALHEIHISVKDNGVGIPEDELEKIFEKFTQSNKTKTGAGGTGLGLAISKEILSGHGGTIVAKNNPSGGATFTISIPRSQNVRN